MSLRFAIFHEPSTGYWWALDSDGTELARSPHYETVDQVTAAIAAVQSESAGAEVVHDAATGAAPDS